MTVRKLACGWLRTYLLYALEAVIGLLDVAVHVHQTTRLRLVVMHGARFRASLHRLGRYPGWVSPAVTSESRKIKVSCSSTARRYTETLPSVRLYELL